MIIMFGSGDPTLEVEWEEERREAWIGVKGRRKDTINFVIVCSVSVLESFFYFSFSDYSIHTEQIFFYIHFKGKFTTWQYQLRYADVIPRDLSLLLRMRLYFWYGSNMLIIPW